MKELGLFFALAIFIVVATKFAQYMLKRMEKLEVQEEESEESEIVYSIPTSINEDYKEVLKKENCSSSRKPIFEDYNDKQNLTEYNHGTYRDLKGRFKSTKKWKKEQKHS